MKIPSPAGGKDQLTVDRSADPPTILNCVAVLSASGHSKVPDVPDVVLYDACAFWVAKCRTTTVRVPAVSPSDPFESATVPFLAPSFQGVSVQLIMSPAGCIRMSPRVPVTIGTTELVLK